eukprot:8948606-Pyramimonas_sp.AAC.1
MRQGRESLATNTARATCAYRRARRISVTDLLNFRARADFLFKLVSIAAIACLLAPLAFVPSSS